MEYLDAQLARHLLGRQYAKWHSHALPILPNEATSWAGFLGTPISYGCVVLDTYDAQVLYDWAEVGVPVEIQW